MKKIIAILAAALLAVGVSSAQTTVSALAQSVADTSVVQDQSKLPDQDNRQGYFFALYDVAVHGGSVGTIELGDAFPDNVLVKGGYIQVITPIAPATSTGSVSLASADDLLTTGTSLQSAGLIAVTPGKWVVATTTTNAMYNLTASNAVVNSVTLSQNAGILTANATNTVKFAITGSAATQGVFAVLLDLERYQ